MPTDRRAVLAAAGLALLVLSGCGNGPHAEGEITLGAAASLRHVLPELLDTYRETVPDARFRVTYAASGTLRAQVEAGAPLDGVLLASDTMAASLVAAGQATHGSRVVVARNVLVLVAAPSADRALRFDTLAALPAGDRIAIGTPDTAPVGTHARTLLRARGVWDRLEEQLVYARDVSAVMAYVKRGEAQVGIAYATDARAAPELAVLDRAEGAEDPAPRVVGVAVAEATHAAAAGAFLAWLTTAPAQAVLAAHGFGKP